MAMNSVFIAKAYRQSTTLNPQLAGELGDFVGGYFGPILSLLGIVLIVTTLKSEQRSAEAERRSMEFESFENRYFELLKMHRDNVSQITLGAVSGTKVFVLMIRELRCIHEIIKALAEDSRVTLTPHQMLHIAYHCLFYGVGPNSSRMLKLSLPEFDPLFVDEVERKLNNEGLKAEVKRARKFGYVPFEGHQSRLGHYYRHLYQMVCFVDERGFKKEKRYEYVKTMRAQLSNHEQALLFVNTLSPIGKDWQEKELLLNYRFVQNIPNGFFDAVKEIDVSEYFPKGYFEWEGGMTSSPHTPTS
jgi:hypothetical protein